MESRRFILKENAKIALRGRYWNVFLVSLLALVISGSFSFLDSLVTWPVSWSSELFRANPIEFATRFYARSGPLSFFALLFSIFVGFPIAIGLARYFVHNHFGNTDSNLLFSGFTRSYANGVGVIFVTKLFIDLWTLLLIIPGIYKYFQYCMVPFILSDNPGLTGTRARDISRILTDGEKGSIFLLYLSFLGWYLLGMACFGVGALFVTPYFNATLTELYLFLRDRAIRAGMVRPEEFGLVPPEQNGSFF